MKNEDGDRTTFTYDAANRVRRSVSLSGTTTYTYDAAGNQHLIETPSGDLTTTTWDFENQTTKVELPSDEIVSFVWNSDHGQVTRENDDDLTRYHWDKNNLHLETDDTNSPTARNNHEPNEYGSLVSRELLTTTDHIYYHYDALGSTSATTDHAGVIADEYQYKAWGEQISPTADPQPYRWVGQLGYRYDEDTERHTLRMRDYGSHIAKFLSEDPIGSAGGDSNLSRISVNTPTNAVDPSGLLWFFGEKFVAPWDQNAAGITSTIGSYGRALRNSASGVLQTVGGASAIAGGTVIATGGTAGTVGTGGAAAPVSVPTAVAGFGLVAYGNDQFQAGASTLINGFNQPEVIQRPTAGATIIAAVSGRSQSDSELFYGIAAIGTSAIYSPLVSPPIAGSLSSRATPGNRAAAAERPHNPSTQAATSESTIQPSLNTATRLKVNPIDHSTLPRPGGMTNHEFGKLMNWSRPSCNGESLAAAIAHSKRLISELSPSRLAELRNAGVTKEMAQKWADFYRYVSQIDDGNYNAAPWYLLLQAIADAL